MTKKHRTILMPHVPGHDYRKVRIGERGFGFVSGDGHQGGPIRLERCPECGRENYAMNVISGICTWCGWDANS